MKEAWKSFFVSAILWGVSLYIPPTAQAQQWARAYGGNITDWASSIIQTPDGGYMVAGYAGSFGAGQYDVWLLRLNALGNLIWQKGYGGTDNEEATSLWQTSDGSYIVAAGTYSFRSGNADGWVFKVNSDGNIAWQKVYGGTNRDWVYSVQETSDGGFVVAGSTRSFGARNEDVWILRLGADGSILWQKAYQGWLDEFATAIRQTSDGGYVVAGSTTSFGAGETDILVLKLRPDGSVIWQKTYGGQFVEWASAIEQTSDGGTIVAGNTTSFGNGLVDFLVLKLNADGNIAWQKTYGGPHEDRVSSVRQTADGGFVVSGWTASFGAVIDVWILKLDPQGNVIWQKTYGTPSFAEEGRSIQQTADGGYIVAGSTTYYGGGQYKDAWVLKLGGNGDIQGCTLVGTTNASPQDATIIPADSALTSFDTSAIATDTNAIVTDTSAVTNTNCESVSCSLDVTTTADIVSNTDSVNSLREAILCANATPGADTIHLPAGTYTLTIAGQNEDAGATGDLDIAESLTLTGAGAGTTIIDAGGIDRVFHIPIPSGGAATVTITGVTITNGSLPTGSPSDGGGGIFSRRATLNLADCIIANNRAHYSGGLYNLNGTAIVDRCTFSGNGAPFSSSRGGAIHNTGTLTLRNSTLSGNTATLGLGGGIYNNGGSVVIQNSTLSGNSASVGGGVHNDSGGQVSLYSVTFSGNTATLNAGAIQNSGTLTLQNTIVAGGGCAGNPLTSNGHNLSTDTSCNLSGAGDLQNANPNLGPLANNGGPTQTHALNTGSPAIDVVPTANCTDAQGNPLTTDQRGEPRPYGPACDIGAFEVQQVQQFTLAITIAGTGNGGVMGTGISCTKSGGVVSGDCSEPFTAGTNVILNAGANTGSTFAGWSGDCTGTSTTTTVLMDANKACTATFNLIPPPTLTITIGPNSPPQGTQYGKGQSNRPMLQFVM
ncbi:MAG: choice-of-anchor Q domain-containing protein, partial [bacterium JZ-2024 1]